MTASRGDLGRLLVAPALIFGHAFGQSLVAQHQAVRDADQVEVGEHHTRAFVAVVEQHVETGGGEIV